MIEKCQCPKPEGADLHFRKATAYCQRCGAGICERCGFHKWGEVCGIPDYKPYFTDVLKVYCRTCAELEGE